MNTREVYKQLTNVDIEKQQQIWDERGKGYYGEYLVFCELYKTLSGYGKILMNLNIPVNGSKTTEIDLLLIHEKGVYVFEIKHYKGTIYGSDTDNIWTQYFRTAKNNTFKNPIKQNQYHIDALRKLYPNVPIHSCIVFTSADCDIRIKQSNTQIDVFTLRDLPRTLSNRFAKNMNKYTMEQIDSIFTELSAYSQMQEAVFLDEKEADFFSWVKPTILKLEEKKDEVEQVKELLIKDRKILKRITIFTIILSFISVFVCVAICVFITIGVVKRNNQELDTFKQKFLHIEEIGNEYIDKLNSYVTISNVELQPLTEDAVSFAATISMTNDTYGITLTEESKYIVMTKSGQIYEYDVFGEHLAYNSFLNNIGKGYRPEGKLSVIQFYGIANPEDISYIKITGVELFKPGIPKIVVKDELEIELYSE